MSKILSKIDLELYANSFRTNNALSETEPLRIKSLLQKLNILTIYRKLSGGFSGMSIKIETNDKCKRFMIVNSGHSIGKQDFTICHELYHLYFQSNFRAFISSAGLFNKKGDPEEYNADIFSSYLLLPQLGLYKIIPEDERAKNKIKISTILAIEHYYGCSHSALLHRLLNMNLIDATYKDELLLLRIKSVARKFGYSTKLYESGNNDEIIGDYGTLANLAWEKGIISESTYLSFLEDIGVDISKIFDNENGEA